MRLIMILTPSLTVIFHGKRTHSNEHKNSDISFTFNVPMIYIVVINNRACRPATTLTDYITTFFAVSAATTLT